MADEKKNIKIDPKHVTIDPQGKVVITHKEFADHLSKMLADKSAERKPFTADALLDANFGCG